MIGCPTGWGALRREDIAVLDGGAPGPWQGDGPADLVVEMPGGMRLCVAPGRGGLALFDALRRPDGAGGMRWTRGGGQVGTLAAAPGDSPGGAEDGPARLGVLHRACAHGLSAEAWARTRAVEALGEAVRLALDARRVVLRPLGMTPQFVLGNGTARPLFRRRADAPDLRAFLLDGACRRLAPQARPGMACLLSCEEIAFEGETASAHARLAALAAVRRHFAPFGLDPTAWLDLPKP